MGGEERLIIGTLSYWETLCLLEPGYSWVPGASGVFFLGGLSFDEGSFSGVSLLERGGGARARPSADDFISSAHRHGLVLVYYWQDKVMAGDKIMGAV